MNVGFQKKERSTQGPPPSQRLAVLSERELHTREEEAAQVIVRAVEARPEIVVRRARPERRFLVEQVVDTDDEVIVSRHPVGCRKIEIVERVDLVGEVEPQQADVGWIPKSRIGAEVVVLDAAYEAPSHRDGGV